MNGGHAEAATGEEGAAPRRGRRPRRRPNGHGEEDPGANGARSSEPASGAEQPSGESGGGMEQAE
jgi:hypothetical protein